MRWFAADVHLIFKLDLKGVCLIHMPTEQLPVVIIHLGRSLVGFFSVAYSDRMDKMIDAGSNNSA